MSGRHTPGPWFAHGFTYPEGVAGDVFAKDHDNVLACTAICRVVQPVSKMDSDLRRPPLDALQSVARKEAQRPTIEANACLIAAAPTMLGDLIEAERMFRWYGDLHAAKPDPEKAARNYEMADRLAATIAKATQSKDTQSKDTPQ